MDGEILRIDSSEVTKLDCPGFCEALTVTSTGTLLACFCNLGVYELRDDWKLLFKYPRPSTNGDNWVYLAEDNGVIAMATHPIPKLINDKFVYNSFAGLWLFSGTELTKVDFPPSQKGISPP